MLKKLVKNIMHNRLLVIGEYDLSLIVFSGTNRENYSGKLDFLASSLI